MGNLPPRSEEEANCRARMQERGCTPGDLRSDIRAATICEERPPHICPVALACFEGELKVCKWLFDHGRRGTFQKLTPI